MARVVLRAVRDLRACPENRRLGRSLLPPTTSANRLGIRRVPPHGVFSKLARGDQFGTTRVMGEWDTLICRVPVSARPIVTRPLGGWSDDRPQYSVEVLNRAADIFRMAGHMLGF